MSDRKPCPFCHEDIHVQAVKCRYCNEWFDERPSGQNLASCSHPDISSRGYTGTPSESHSGSPLGAPSGSHPSNPSGHTPLIGIHLVKHALGNRYEVIEKIGSGGMATVYKAIQKNLNRPVALKVIHQNLVHDEEFVKRFHREAQISASLQHPNIVTIYDVGEAQGVHYMAMEYLEGTNLHELIDRQGRFTQKQTLQYLLPVAEALAYAHERSYIHRDIKSANIFITGSGRVVLMDFGIAHAAVGTQLTRAGTVIGTLEYMSPEQAEGKKVDHRTDLYSLGVVMYECLAGRVPFKGEQAVVTIHKVIYEQPNLNGVGILQPGLQNLISSLLSKQKDQRPATATLLVNSIRLLHNGVSKQQTFQTSTIQDTKPAENLTIKVEQSDQNEMMIKNTSKSAFLKKYITKDNLKWWIIIIWAIGVSISIRLYFSFIQKYHNILAASVLFLTAFAVAKLFRLKNKTK